MSVAVAVGAEATVQQESFDGRARLLAQMNEQEQKAAEKAREDAKKSPFDSFYQVNIKNNKYLTELAAKQPKALAILLFVFENMDNYNALMASYKVFQEKFDLSQSTVKRCIKYLKDHGYLYIYKSGTSNVYVANDNLAWKSYGKNTKYCKFPANVMLSLSEQEQADDSLKKQRITVMQQDSEITA